MLCLSRVEVTSRSDDVAFYCPRVLSGQTEEGVLTT